MPETKHDDTDLVEAIVRYVTVDLANDEARRKRQALTTVPDPPLNYTNGQSKHLFLYLIDNDPTFKAAIDRPNCPRSFAAALKRIFKPLRERGVILTLNGNGYLTLEKA